MGLPAFSISFEYRHDSVDNSDEIKRVLNALDCVKQLSSEVGAGFAPKFHDPVLTRINKELVRQLIDDNRIGARIKRWWSNAAPKVDPSEVVDVITASRPVVSMRDFDSPTEWAELAIAAVAENEGHSVCVYAWDHAWKTINLWLYLCRDEHDLLAINGVLLSTEAYDNASLRLPMHECLSRLKQLGKFRKK